jgi:hypothetical protein
MAGCHRRFAMGSLGLAIAEDNFLYSAMKPIMI